MHIGCVRLSPSNPMLCCPMSRYNNRRLPLRGKIGGYRDNRLFPFTHARNKEYAEADLLSNRQLYIYSAALFSPSSCSLAGLLQASCRPLAGPESIFLGRYLPFKTNPPCPTLADDCLLEEANITTNLHHSTQSRF